MENSKKAKSDPNYSMIEMGTMNSENIYEVPANSNTGSENKIGEDVKKGEDIKRSNKLIYLVSIVMLLAIVGCFVALFLEVAKLHSEASSFKKKLTEQTPIIMHHIEDRFRIY